MAGQVVLFRDSPPKKKEDSITVLVCRNVPEAVLTCRSSGCSSTVAYFRWILILLGHAISCSLYISVSRLIALRSWRLCHPRSLIISVKLDFYDNRFSHSVQLCIELSLVLPHHLFRQDSIRSYSSPSGVAPGL